MDEKTYAEVMLTELFALSRAQFGSAVRSQWFFDGDDCPGCDRRVDFIKSPKGNQLSLNTFIYRKRGVLIGYLLCSRCAKKIHRDAKRNPGRETERHAAIEANLIQGYHDHMNSLDA